MLYTGASLIRYYFYLITEVTNLFDQKSVSSANTKVTSMTYDVEDSSKIVNTLKNLQSFKNIKITSARAQELLEKLTYEEPQVTNV